MSFMPNVGSFVRLLDGRYGMVSNVTPDGRGDEVLVMTSVVRVTAFDIAEVIYEPEALDV